MFLFTFVCKLNSKSCGLSVWVFFTIAFGHCYEFKEMPKLNFKIDLKGIQFRILSPKSILEPWSDYTSFSDKETKDQKEE